MGAKIAVVSAVVAAALVAGCGGSSGGSGSDNPSSDGSSQVEFTWEKGTAPGTGTAKWATIPPGEDLNEACEALQDQWPSGTQDLGVTVVSGDERIVCVQS